MKKFLTLLVITLGCISILEAQSVWKPINVPGTLKGVAANGDLFCGETGILRSQDEGETWQTVLEGTYYNHLNGFTISPKGRIFTLPYNESFLYYSDDGGDTWETSSNFLSSHLENAPMCAVSNDTLLVYGSRKLYWTFDGGTTWSETSLSFIADDVFFGDMVVDGYNNVFISIYNWLIPSQSTVGIFNASLNNLNQWNQWKEWGAKDMEVDRLNNVYATSGSTFYHQYGFYLVPADRIAVDNNQIVYTTQRIDDENCSLAYSTDRGEHFTTFGEPLPSTLTAPDVDMGLFKGLDRHLYCYSDVLDPYCRTYYKSIHVAENIVSGLLDRYWVDLVTEQPEGYVIDANGNVQIWSSEALAWLISTVNGLNGQEPNDFSGKKVTLRADVDMSAAIWTTIAQGTNFGDPNPDRLKFCGTFDGNGFEISGLYLYYPTMQEFDAFFGHLCGATIKNVTIRHAYASGRSTRDGLFFANADSETVIDRCRFEVDEVYKSDMNEDYAIFGFRNEGTITNCMTKIKKVDYEGDLGINMDMFVLWNEGTIQNCASVVDSVKWLYSYAGIAGTNDGLIENCYSFIGTFFGGYEIWWPPAPRQGMCFYNHGTIRNGYYNTLAPEYYITNNAAYVNDGTIEQTSPFDWNDGWLLTDTIMETNDLTEALNNWIEDQNMGDAFVSWCGNDTFAGHNLPELCNLNPIMPIGSEWYYEILFDDGSITYQHLECVGDTLFDRAGKRPKVIVRSNTHYDRDVVTEVTHEYVYEEDGIVYWWNHDLQAFTTLYNLNAIVGDEWEIQVGTENLTMHVDAVNSIEYEGRTYRMLSVSDTDDLFSGDIVCGIGHLTSFFPEKLMNLDKGFHVEGLRCYWVENELVFKIGEEDCDAIYDELHGVNETQEFDFTLYPNPAINTLFVEPQIASQQTQTYHITNLMGQTVLSGTFTAETQQIDIANLPAGMYFISVGEQTVKFVKQ